MASNRPLFERRHYAALAASLGIAYGKLIRAGDDTYPFHVTRSTITNRLAKDNPKFNRDRFYSAIDASKDAYCALGRLKEGQDV